MAVYGRREFVCLNGGPASGDRPMRAADRGRRDVVTGRARRLQDAIRDRFHIDRTDEEFDAWNEQQAARDVRLALQLTQIFVDIDRGHTPTPHHVSALAAAAGWSFERVCRALDIDFALLPRLHAMLGAERTFVERSGYAVASTVVMPTDLVPGVTRRSMSLTELVVDWAKPALADWADTSHRLSGQIGRVDNLAYPRLPSGAAVLIDGANTTVDGEGYYAVQHPNGFSCARVAIDQGELSLLSEDRERYPRLDFPLTDVRVLGRVRAFAGRIDRLQPPAPVNLGDLIDIRRPLIDPARLREISSPALLRDIWARRGLSFSQFERKVRLLRSLMGRRFTIGRGHMHDLMQADATSQDSVPRVETQFALAAIFLLSPHDLFRGYGLPVDDLPLATSDEALNNERVRAHAERLRQHPLVAHLEERGWDLAWLLSLYRRPAPGGRLFYLDDISPGMTPLLKPSAFISVNLKQRRIVTTVRGRPVETLRDWERPIYLLQTSGRHRFVCGYCELRGETIVVVPHPDAPSQRVQRFRHPDQAIVLGRVTHVATLME